jgi:hypothetical protein
LKNTLPAVKIGGTEIAVKKGKEMIQKTIKVINL